MRMTDVSTAADSWRRIAPGGAGSSARLLEAEDVARYLSMRTDWVYREVRAGQLPHVRLGRAARFRRESIEAWIQSRERGASNGSSSDLSVPSASRAAETGSPAPMPRRD